MVHEAWAQTTEEILGRDACFRDQQSMGAHAFTLKSLQSEMPKVLKMQANTPTLSEVKEKVGKELLRRSGLKAAAKAAPESVAMSSFSAEDAAGTGTLALANEPHEDEEDDDGQPLLKANKVGLRMRGSGRGRGHGARGGRVSRGSRPSVAQRRAVEKRGRMPKDPNGAVDSESDVVASPKRPSMRRGGSSASLGGVDLGEAASFSLCCCSINEESEGFEDSSSGSGPWLQHRCYGDGYIGLGRRFKHATVICYLMWCGCSSCEARMCAAGGL